MILQLKGSASIALALSVWALSPEGMGTQEVPVPHEAGKRRTVRTEETLRVGRFESRSKSYQGSESVDRHELVAAKYWRRSFEAEICDLRLDVPMDRPTIRRKFDMARESLVRDYVGPSTGPAEEVWIYNGWPVGRALDLQCTGAWIPLRFVTPDGPPDPTLEPQKLEVLGTDFSLQRVADQIAKSDQRSPLLLSPADLRDILFPGGVMIDHTALGSPDRPPGAGELWIRVGWDALTGSEHFGTSSGTIEVAPVARPQHEGLREADKAPAPHLKQFVIRVRTSSTSDLSKAIRAHVLLNGLDESDYTVRDTLKTDYVLDGKLEFDEQAREIRSLTLEGSIDVSESQEVSILTIAPIRSGSIVQTFKASGRLTCSWALDP